MAIQDVSPNAEIVGKQQALRVNASAAVGLMNVLKSNLGPTGTLKLLVGGTVDQLKLTKDGVTLLKEMQIQHPTAALIARTATAQDEIVGDGTTSVVLLTGELLRVAEQSIVEGLHPRILTDGLDIARDAALEFLKNFSVAKPDAINDRELLLGVARTSLSTKLEAGLVSKLSSAVVEAIQTIYQPDAPLDLNRVELLTLSRRSAEDSLRRWPRSRPWSTSPGHARRIDQLLRHDLQLVVGIRTDRNASGLCLLDGRRTRKVGRVGTQVAR